MKPNPKPKPLRTRLVLDEALKNVLSHRKPSTPFMMLQRHPNICWDSDFAQGAWSAWKLSRNIP
jgi:hypothetical protein